MEPIVFRTADARFSPCMGAEFSVAVCGNQTGGCFSMTECVADPGVTIPRHWHRKRSESFYLIQGRLEFCLDDFVVESGAGSTVFIPMGTLHSWKVISDYPARFMIYSNPAGLETMLGSLNGRLESEADISSFADMLADHDFLVVGLEKESTGTNG